MKGYPPTYACSLAACLFVARLVSISAVRSGCRQMGSCHLYPRALGGPARTDSPHVSAATARGGQGLNDGRLFASGGGGFGFVFVSYHGTTDSSLRRHGLTRT